jgi:spermidine synthase
MTRSLYTFCFFLSGAAGLTYQIVWVRMFSLAFGNTVYAVSLVVAAFLAGLALGSHVLGNMADRMKNPKGAYVLLEVLIAVFALLVSASIGVVDDFMAARMTVESLTSGGWQAARFAMAFLALLAPTFVMGGTLPVMSKFYVDSMAGLGRGIGALYAANTYGAMAGCFLSGAVMIRYLGIWNTLFAAFLTNFLVAGLVWLTPDADPRSEEKATESTAATLPAGGRKGKKRKGEQEEAPIAPPVPEAAFTPFISPGAAMALLMVAGFCSIAFEILWTRAFVVSFKSTVYLFSGLLSMYLLGMALGSHVFSRWLDSVKDPIRLFGLAQAGVGLWGFLSVPIFIKAPAMAAALGGLFSHMTLGRDLLVMAILMAVSILPPAFLMGISYPLILKAITESLGVLGGRSGKAYAMGTLGGIAGSLVAGFIILPSAGLQTGIFLVAAFALLAGFTGMAMARERRSLAWALPGGSAAALFAVSIVSIAGADVGLGRVVKEKVAFSREGVMGSVRALQEWKGGPLTLMVNDYQLATSGDVAVRFGHVPMILKPDAKDALVISLGSGITAGAVGGHPLERIECVEIVPTLLEVQRLFEKDNHNIVADKRFHLTFWDGRNYVRVTKRKYDLVISDLFQPDSAGVGSLYTLEHFLNVKATLKPGGAMAQWLPLYQLSPHDLKVIMRTFAYAYEKVTVWSGDINSQSPTLLLMGSASDLDLGLGSLAKGLSQERAQKDMIEAGDPFSFLSFYVMDRAGVLEYTKGHPVNTDVYPVIEFSAPGAIWGRGAFAVENFASMAGSRGKIILDAGDPEKSKALNEALGAYYEARTHLLQGKLDHARRDYPAELESYKKAYKLAGADPFLGLAVFDLGYVYYDRGDHRTSAEVFDWARKINPRLLEAYFYAAKSYQRLGQTEKAEKALADLALINPELAEQLVKR